jgi:hypothetical protein
MGAATLFDASAIADAILRTSDSVDFFVIKLLLCLVSPTFGDIFSSNHTIDSEDETQNRLPIFSVTEDSRTLRYVLLSIYPPCVTRCEPVLDVDDLFPVTKAIRKYSIDCIECRIKEMVVTSQLLQEHAFRIYALAVHLGWTDIAARAALNTLETPLSKLPFVDELRMISGADFYQYLSYRFKRGKCKGDGEKPQLAFVSHGPVVNEQHSAIAVADVPAAFGPNAKVDAILRSSDGIDFYIKKDFLGHLSPVFEELFANGDSTALNNPGSDPLAPTIEEDNDAALNSQRDDPPVFTLEEDSITLSGLLCLLHPYAGEPCISDLKYFPRIWAAAQRYQVTFIFQRLEQLFLAFPSIRKEPLRSFAISVNLGWTKAINACAMETLIKPLSEMEYADEVRIITGADLYRLVEYRFKCANSVGLFLDDMAKSEPAATLNMYTMYLAAVKSRLSDCPGGTTMSTDDDLELVKAAKAYSVKSTYYTSVQHLLQKRRILFVTIDNIISKVCLPTLFR